VRTRGDVLVYGPRDSYSIAQSYISAIKRLEKEASAMILSRIAILFGESIEWRWRSEPNFPLHPASSRAMTRTSPGADVSAAMFW
jgi:hypothetical protein